MEDPEEDESSREAWPRRAWFPIELSSALDHGPRPLRRFGQNLVAWRDEAGRAVVHDASGAWPVHEEHGVIWSCPGTAPELLLGLPAGMSVVSNGGASARCGIRQGRFGDSMAQLGALATRARSLAAVTLISEAAFLVVGDQGLAHDPDDILALDDPAWKDPSGPVHLMTLCGAAPVDSTTTWWVVRCQATSTLVAAVQAWCSSADATLAPTAASARILRAWTSIHDAHLRAQRWEEGRTGC
jgi:hypothetical protein